MAYKEDKGITYSCLYKVVFCPKYKRKILVNGIGKRLEELIRNTCRELEVEILNLKILPNLVELLLQTTPRRSIHTVVKAIKRESYRALSQEFDEINTRLPTLWTNAYFVSTVGTPLAEGIRSFIEKQETSQEK